jgi:pyridoxine kinase
MQAARVLAPPQILATSVPVADGVISNILIDKGAREIFRADVPDKGKVPNGTGDLLSALYLGHRLRGASVPEAFSLAIAGVDAAIDASIGQDELALAASAEAWADPQPWPLRKL